MNSDVYNFNLGARIIELRKRKGWSSNRLANMAGINNTYLLQVEKGQVNMSVDRLTHVCFALGISLSEFFEDSGQHSKCSPTSYEVYKRALLLTDKQRRALIDLIDSFQQ